MVQLLRIFSLSPPLSVQVEELSLYLHVVDLSLICTCVCDVGELHILTLLLQCHKIDETSF